MYVIYLLTNNLNGKKFYGCTDNIKIAIQNHRDFKERGTVNKAIASDGWDNFTSKNIKESTNRSLLMKTYLPELVKIHETWDPDKGYNDEFYSRFHPYYTSQKEPEVEEVPEVPEVPEEVVPESWTFLGPNGEVEVVTDINVFAESNDLTVSALLKLISGDQITHKGWTISN